MHAGLPSTHGISAAPLAQDTRCLIWSQAGRICNWPAIGQKSTYEPAACNAVAHPIDCCGRARQVFRWQQSPFLVKLGEHEAVGSTLDMHSLLHHVCWPQASRVTGRCYQAARQSQVKQHHTVHVLSRGLIRVCSRGATKDHSQIKEQETLL